MPLVFAENEATESGIAYDDRTGVSYQYPSAYRRTIKPGERFVYYRGRRRLTGGRLPQVYFGTGVVGNISEDPHHAGRLVCEVLDFQPFHTPVPFRDSTRYLESGAERKGFFQRGVRTISEADYRRILEIADEELQAAPLDERIGHGADPPIGRRASGIHYASPEKARAVEEYSMQVAIREAQRRFPDCSVQPQPRNNPGFDLLVVGSEGRKLFIEVKGTERAAPHFFATEGELQFSRVNSGCFHLIVVYGIRMAIDSCEVLWREGAISGDRGFILRPVQWACVPASAVEPSPSQSVINGSD